MRFAGFTEKSYAEAIIRGLKNQKVFKIVNNTIVLNKIKNEFIIHFTGQRILHSSSSIIDFYQKAVSDKKDVTAKGFPPTLITTFEINRELLSGLVQETKDFIFTEKEADNKIIQNLRWHDIAVILLLQKLGDSRFIETYGKEILALASKITPDFQKEILRLTVK